MRRDDRADPTSPRFPSAAGGRGGGDWLRPEQGLRLIAYVSERRLPGDPAAALEEIVAAAAARNAEEGLTGALFCSPNYFAQVLEGPEAAVNRAFERIRVDPRHAHVRLLHAGPTRLRSFPGWGMASAGILGADEALHAVLARLGPEVRAGEAATEDGRAAMANLLRLLRERELG